VRPLAHLGVRGLRRALALPDAAGDPAGPARHEHPAAGRVVPDAHGDPRPARPDGPEPPERA